MKKTLISFSLAGIIFPSILFIINSYVIKAVELEGVLLILYIFLWPSSLGIRESSLGALIFSMVVNSLYYLVIGFLLWFGINKSRLVLYVSIVAFVLLWGSFIIAIS